MEKKKINKEMKGNNIIMSCERMSFENNYKDFLNNFSFEDIEEVYTNGAELIPVFRVEQMIEHYFEKKIIESENIRRQNESLHKCMDAMQDTFNRLFKEGRIDDRALDRWFKNIHDSDLLYVLFGYPDIDSILKSYSRDEILNIVYTYENSKINEVRNEQHMPYTVDDKGWLYTHPYLKYEGNKGDSDNDK